MSDRPYVNLLDPEFYVDPWDAYRWFRDNDPVFWDPVQRLWGISRFEDVMHVEKHPQRYTSYQGSRPHIDQTGNTSMIDQDDPVHQRHRALIHRRFTPRAVSTQEDEVREVARGLVDTVAARGECEAVEALASRLPAIMIGRRLGYTPKDWERVRHWSETTMHQGGQTDPDGGPFPVGDDAGKAGASSSITRCRSSTTGTPTPATTSSPSGRRRSATARTAGGTTPRSSRSACSCSTVGRRPLAP